jgi:hypothetical protein
VVHKHTQKRAKMSTSTAEPTAHDVVMKTLTNLKKIGSPAQQREAAEIERRLNEQANAVNFARRGKAGRAEEDKR